MRREEEAVRKYLNGPMEQKRFSGIVSDWDDYLRLFAASRGEGAVGEASVCYLWSKTAAAAIAAHLPHARIIIILRHPAERAFSQYLHNVSDGVVSHSFRNHIDAILRQTDHGLGVLNPFLELGLYANQVKRYLDLFPAEQVGIWLYEETRNRPTEFLAEVLRFLWVDPSFALNTSTKHLQPQIPRMTGISQTMRRNGTWAKLKSLTPAPLRPLVRSVAYRKNGSVGMSPRDRSFLVDYYRQDIGNLGTVLNRDLSSWLH
jgi:hypothetical protein